MGKRRKSARRDGQRGTRRTGSKQPREALDLIVEGATEKAYLAALLEYRYPGMFTPHWHRSGSGSRTSLKDLLDKARREERDGRCQEVIWVVCDVDKNEVHYDLLEKWREMSAAHRSALQAISIESWFLQHLGTPARPTSSREALRLVSNQWNGYKKGDPIPEWLIEQTDLACDRERSFLGRQSNDGIWPVDRSSQIPLLIDYLDERARARGQTPRSKAEEAVAPGSRRNV